VQVNAYNVLNGLVIEVMDAGVGMGPHALARAELALATEGVGFELSALGQTPRLGLAVVGRLAAVAGFEVALESPGSGGGVRAVVRVPAALLREIREVQEITGPPMELATRAAAQTTDIAEAPAPARAQRPTAFTAQGLPRRRRFTGEVASPSASLSAPQSGSRSPASPTAPTSDRPPGLWLSAFHAAVHGDENGARQ
jgi:hypothetical protein